MKIMHEILLTCPPMIGMVEKFREDFKVANFNVTVPSFTQEMSEDALCDIIGGFDGWIIGDDLRLASFVQGKRKIEGMHEMGSWN